MIRPDIAAIRERCEKATAGPWQAWVPAFTGKWTVGIFGPAPHEVHPIQSRDDMEFIAHARQDIHALLARLEAVEGLMAYVTHWPGCKLHVYDGRTEQGQCTCGLTARLAELGLEK